MALTWTCEGIFLHNWDKWQKIGEGCLRKSKDELGDALATDGKPIVVGIFEQQRRECKRCGKSQLRVTKA